MSLVILNLADPGQMGPVTMVKSGLQGKLAAKKKTSVTVGDEVVPIYDMFDELANAASLKASKELMDIAAACDAAEKIYVCTHGTASDTEHAFAKASGGAALATCMEFGLLLAKVLPNTSKQHKIALVMCYGARTENYRSSDLDHQGMIPVSMLRTSFAYKLFRQLVEDGRSIKMTARTGAVTFDRKTGVSAVEQEAAIDISLDKEEFLRAPKTTATIDAWKTFKDQAMAAGKAADAVNKKAPSKTTDWVKTDSKFKTNPDASTGLFASGVEKAGKAYYQVIAQKNALEQRKSQYQDLAKYGKIVYTSSGSGITIVSKYGNQKDLGPGTVLYTGPLI